VNRTLGLFDLVCLGFNCVIGAGIFTTPGDVASALGSLAPGAYLVGALLCFPIALCFARMARLEPGTGGACLYARRAFGPTTGFVVGWVMWLSGIIGGATVALQFGQMLAPTHGVALGAAVVLAFSCINWLGSRGGAWSNNLLAVGKLVPLALFLLWALWRFPLAGLAYPAAASVHLDPKFGLLLILFSFSGFEEIGLPAGEVRRPERNVPLALLIVLATCTLVYSLVQGAVGCLGLVGSAAPLVQATASVPWLSAALMVGGVLSLASVNASINFTTPRSLWTLAEQGWMPAWLRPLSSGGSPTRCIAISMVLMLTLLCSSHRKQLLSLSVLASLLQYLSTALAAGRERLSLAPVAAVAVCAGLLACSRPSDLQGMAISILAGLLLYSRRARSSSEGVVPASS
jgi:APA family basic amino acid/polyamine antiporter